jgi:hypothetical protein
VALIPNPIQKNPLTQSRLLRCTGGRVNTVLVAPFAVLIDTKNAEVEVECHASVRKREMADLVGERHVAG